VVLVAIRIDDGGDGASGGDSDSDGCSGGYVVGTMAHLERWQHENVGAFYVPTRHFHQLQHLILDNPARE
jgi:hypothetical protein